jgi:aldose 1-epimerase
MHNWNLMIVAGAALWLSAAACGCRAAAKHEVRPATAEAKMGIEKTAFGTMPDGRPIDLYTMTNGSGMRVRVINYGATLISVEVPDRRGKVADVTLGYDTLEGWLANRGSFGATIGRYGNRIARGEFTLDGTTYELAKNSGENHIHGGVEGFSKKLWTAEPVRAAAGVGVRLTYLSRDGEEGYPGNLKASVLYILTADNELKTEFTATTDKPTVINLVNHAYWNLGGPEVKDCLGHVLQLNADEYTVAGPGLIPTGELKPVAGTPLDFTRPVAIGARIAQTEGGYDHNLVIRGKPGEVRLAARAVEPASGRVMELYTDQPGVQFYSANFQDGSITGKGGVAYRRHAGFCLETQHFPDSPNHDNFPSTVLRPSQTYRHIMVHKFSTQ